MHPRSVAALGALLLSSTPALAQGPGPLTCGTSAPVADSHIAVTAVYAEVSPGVWEDALAAGKLRVCVSYFEQYMPGLGQQSQSNVSVAAARGHFEDAYPPETRFSVSFETPAGAPEPLSLTGGVRDAVARIAGTAGVLQGRASTAKSATTEDPGPPPQPRCDGPTVTNTAFSFAVGLDSGLTGARKGLGSYFMSNAQTWAPPTMAGHPAMAYGCGDDDPSTLEGFIEGLFASGQLPAYGISPAVLDQPASVVDALFVLTDNGKPKPGAVFATRTATDELLAAIPGVVDPGPGGDQIVGVRVDYELSYSAHNVRTKVHKKNLKAAKACIAKKRTTRVVRGKVRCG